MAHILHHIVMQNGKVIFNKSTWNRGRSYLRFRRLNDQRRSRWFFRRHLLQRAGEGSGGDGGGRNGLVAVYLALKPMELRKRSARRVGALELRQTRQRHLRHVRYLNRIRVACIVLQPGR